MDFAEGEIRVSTPSDVYPEHTKTFVSLLTRMINKGIDNPAYQLHVLSIICTGKSFSELITRNVADAEHMIEAARSLAEGILDVVTQSGSMSVSTIDDMLKKYGKGGRGEDNSDDEE